MVSAISDLTAPQPFDDPTIETDARKALNLIVLELLKRTVQPLAQRAPTLGGLEVIEDPDLAEHIMRNPQIFQKNFALVAALGESRFNLNGPRWEMFRDRTQLSYNKASKPAERPAVASQYQTAIDAFDPDNLNTVEELLGTAAVKIFSQALQINPDSAAIIALFPQVRTHAMLLQHFSWGGVKEHGVLWQRADWLDTQFSTLFMNDPQCCDFVQQATIGQGDDAWHPAITDLMQNTFAGTETTVATLCWAIRLVGQNQQLQDHLREETQQDSVDHPLMRSFLNEVMRCVPPIPFVVRELTQNYQSHGHHFRKGQQIILSIIGLHKHPFAWTDPNQFHATRPEFMQSKTPPKAFRPFLSGPRVCGGKRLAELEMMTAMPAILRKWHITTDQVDIGFEYALAMRPASLAGIRIAAI
jgi:cytochrome P450